MFGLRILIAIWHMLLDVLRFWWRVSLCPDVAGERAVLLWKGRPIALAWQSPVDLWLHLLHGAETYEDWEEAALHLDNLLGLDLWRNNPVSQFYDYRLINQRLNTLATAREENDLYQIINLLRSGLVRDLGSITAPRLYNKAFAGTKYLIEEYISQIAECIEEITALPTVTPYGGGGGGYVKGVPQLTTQMKLDFIHDTRQAFGRSTLLIRTAAVASNASSTSLYGHQRTTLLCKDAQGEIVDWAPPGNTIDFRHWSQVSYADRESPLLRVAELLNVTHFIVSQARPYLIPFLQSDMHGPSLTETRSRTTQMTSFLVRMVGLEVRHRLRQLDTLNLYREASGVDLADFSRLLEQPTTETLDYWILKGERSVYQAVAALRVRCTVENELERSYQVVRRLKAFGLRRKTSTIAASSLAS
ncbi:unnamed protein product [Parascedosporium putredinis]|uniref:Triacylglycerol lipase N-terminal domain-containing protein n=1 Tax=Parascedosporium putredinis TaxID=1442378 RepID=A0A9P1MDA3_9PEZI|nr:unnamed protein product [Parascedosporium putredinis]CAI7998279.1 unnamed protein product [Parascedosporium putredinis]